MKKVLALVVSLLLVMSTVSVFAESEAYTSALDALKNYTPKTDKLVIMTSNSILEEGNDTDRYLEELLGVEIEWIITNEHNAKLTAMAADGQLPDLICVPNNLILQ